MPKKIYKYYLYLNSAISQERHEHDSKLAQSL